jgi:anti-sigma B factor antagonist
MPKPTPRHLTSRTEQGTLVLTITEEQMRGDHLARALQRQLQEVVTQAGPAPRVVLDFRPVRVLSSEVFRPLLSLRRHLQEAGGRLVLCNLAPAVAQVFQSTRMISTSRTSTTAFEVRPDVASAVATLNQDADEA